MNLEDVQRAEKIRQQINQLESFINHERRPIDKVLIIKQEPKFKLAIKTRYFFDEKTMVITSEVLSDAIKKALKQTIEDLKSQLIELGVEVNE